MRSLPLCCFTFHKRTSKHLRVLYQAVLVFLQPLKHLCPPCCYYWVMNQNMGRVVQLVQPTGYRLDGPGIKSQWGRDFLHLSRPALGSTQPAVQCVRGLSRGQRRPRRGDDPHPIQCRGPRKSTAIPLLTLRAFVPYKKGETYLFSSNRTVNTSFNTNK